MTAAALVIAIAALLLAAISCGISVRALTLGPPTPQRCLDCQTMQGEQHSLWCQYAQPHRIEVWVDEATDLNLEPWQRAFIRKWMRRHDGRGVVATPPQSPS